MIAKRLCPIYIAPSKPIIESEPSSPTAEQKLIKSPCREVTGPFDANYACFHSSEDVDNMHLLEPFDFCQGNFELPVKKAPCRAPVRGLIDPRTRAWFVDMADMSSCDPTTPSYDPMSLPYAPMTPSYEPMSPLYNPMAPPMTTGSAVLCTASGPPSPSYDPWRKGKTKLCARKLAKQLRKVEMVEKVEGKKRKRWSDVVDCEAGCTFCVLKF